MQPTVPSDPPTSWLALGRYEVAYSVEGGGETVILAVPGLPGSSRDFRWLAAELGGWARVIRFDPPGYGRSPRPGFAAMDASRKADLVLDMMARLSIARAVLLGHSFGCVVAARVAAARPDAVSRLVLLAPPGVRAHYPVAVVHIATALLRSERGRELTRGLQRRGYRRAGFPSFLTDDELHCTSLDSGTADFAGYRRDLEAVSQPTMIAWALDDRQVPPHSSAALHKHTAAGPRVAFVSGGHNIQKTRAVELGSFVKAFVAQEPPPALPC